jgi:hypothetical protein
LLATASKRVSIELLTRTATLPIFPRTAVVVTPNVRCRTGKLRRAFWTSSTITEQINHHQFDQSRPDRRRCGLFLVALTLDDSRLVGILEMKTYDKGAPRYENGHLCP